MKLFLDPELAHVEFFPGCETPPHSLQHDGSTYLDPLSFRLLLSEVPLHEPFDNCGLFVQKISVLHHSDFLFGQDTTQAILNDQGTLVPGHPLYFRCY